MTARAAETPNQPSKSRKKQRLQASRRKYFERVYLARTGAEPPQRGDSTSATVSYRGFTANIWGNLDTKPYADDQSYSSNFTETDVTLSHSHQFGIVTAGAGYITMDWPL